MLHYQAGRQICGFFLLEEWKDLFIAFFKARNFVKDLSALETANALQKRPPGNIISKDNGHC